MIVIVDYCTFFGMQNTKTKQNNVKLNKHVEHRKYLCVTNKIFVRREVGRARILKLNHESGQVCLHDLADRFIRASPTRGIFPRRSVQQLNRMERGHGELVARPLSLRGTVQEGHQFFKPTISWRTPHTEKFEIICDRQT